MRNPTSIEMDSSDGAATIDSGRGEIAALAYQLWNDRGCPVGSPDEDWFRAEELLKGRTIAAAA